MMPTTFGRYRVIRTLGEGAGGCVFVARDEVLGREVAVKALKPLVMQFGGTQRFVNEARAIAQLEHANVVRVFDVGEEAGVPYLVMEMAPGSLKDRLQRGPLATAELRALGIQIAHALAAAHARGIVHRDVKPANVLEADGGMWKLADFGVAHVPDSDATITGQFLGSPAYAAPESLASGAFGPTSDVYGLAATLFEAATGRKPHDARGYATRLSAGDDATTVHRGALAEIDPVIANAIARGLARSPGDRPAAAELAALLANDGALPAGAPIAIPAGLATTSSMTTPARRRLAMIAIAIAVLLLVIGAARGGGGRSSDEPTTGREHTPPAVRAPAETIRIGDRIEPTRERARKKSKHKHGKYRDDDDDDED